MELLSEYLLKIFFEGTIDHKITISYDYSCFTFHILALNERHNFLFLIVHRVPESHCCLS